MLIIIFTAKEAETNPNLNNDDITSVLTKFAAIYNQYF